MVTTFFPAVCRICEASLVRAAALPVCDLCLSALRPQAETHPGLLCTTCGESIGFEDERFLAGHRRQQQRCTPCRRLPPPFTHAVAFGVYAGELRDLIGLLKFSRLRAAAAPLGRLLAASIAELAPYLHQTEETLVVAVPLFRGKARERGFNQAELLSTCAIEWLRRSHPALRLRAAPSLVVRHRATESQFGLNPRQRRRNLRDAFLVPHPALVAGRDVLLVDDIYTTGATARACAQVLRQAGAREIVVATVSRAQRESVALWDGAGLSHGAASHHIVNTSPLPHRRS